MKYSWPFYMYMSLRVVFSAIICSLFIGNSASAQPNKQDKGIAFGVKTFGLEVERSYQVARLATFSASAIVFWSEDRQFYQTLDNRIALTIRYRRYYHDWITGPYLLLFTGVSGIEHTIDTDTSPIQVLLGSGIGYDFDKDEIKRIQLELQGGGTATGRYYVGIGVNILIW